MTLFRRSGKIFAQTTVQIPEELRDAASRMGISLSRTLTWALETKMKEDNAVGQQLPTNKAPRTPSSTDKPVEQECSGVEQAPTSQPAAPSGTPKRSKGQ